MKLVLASASPRRRELLQEAGLTFEVIPSTVEQNVPEDISQEERVKALARLKAEDVFAAHPDATVIGSDTLVFFNGKALGKPGSEEEAKAMLRMLSGRVHTVSTGVCICSAERTICFAETTEVEFFELSEEEIEAYVASFEPMDKAGSYGIQGLGAVLVRRIVGDYNNVVGLPLARTVRALRDL